MDRVRNWLFLPGFLIVSSLLLLLRFILKTPQPLASLLPGSDHLYKWTYGHIFYKVYGTSDAPPLLLLHAPGIGASAHEMLPLMESLAPHYHIYAPDLPGSGLSDTPDIDYTADIFVAFCRDFLYDVVQQPATLLAHGLSCEYALAVATRSPELCTQLVLFSPNYPHKYFSTLPHHYGWLSRIITHNRLLGIFVYALLTPRSILRQIMHFQRGGAPVSQDDLTYAFAAAHQLGAQYVALAYITGKLSLDVTLETPPQPTLLLWNTRPPINTVTQYYSNLPQVQTVFLNTVRYYRHASTHQNVTAALLEWQDTRQKALSAAISTKNARRENAAPAPSDSLPHPTSLPDATNRSTGVVEDSQPTERQSEDASTSLPTSIPVEAFCVKCKQKRPMLDAHKIVTRNGRNAMEGRCPVCSTKLFRFVSG
jgi:pimeloyl-ACP methyl ester carboxylesterase